MDWGVKISILIWLNAFLFCNIVCMYLICHAYLLRVHKGRPHRHNCGEASISNLMDRQTFSSSSSNSVNQPKSSTSSKRKRNETSVSTSSKRKRNEISMSSIEFLMEKWMENALSLLRNLIDKLMQPPPQQTIVPDPDSSARIALFEALAEIPELSQEDLVIMTRHLANNKADMDIFWSMHKEARARLVQLLLNGHLPS